MRRRGATTTTAVAALLLASSVLSLAAVGPGSAAGVALSGRRLKEAESRDEVVFPSTAARGEAEEVGLAAGSTSSGGMDETAGRVRLRRLLQFNNVGNIINSGYGVGL